ncbi:MULTISPECIES: alpha/beta hydrolase [unclassified Mycobacterium]|uniref:alpha/beta hydrolase n=1 Tax=unclassified Mycobacterium TaxID=2642494 RepID=UPI00073FE007|nr:MULTISPECIES: alpha/beta hydrolase [unclassified Mycobacterium]KUH83898.1 hydrolase [Mycobacterium sp. IS-1556]KUH88482.1 hydrolase [Mycobacterium sp. GA-0227b]KUH89688.1 hydrolase [Mycobacterium sp. GA-1999]
MSAMWRVGRMVSAFAAVSVIACPVGSASPEGQSAQAYGQPPNWGGCERIIGAEKAAAIPAGRCGTVSVPVDYTKPSGAQAQLAVIRVPATGDRIGVLVVNPGGPGASAVETVAGMGAALADSEIGRRFDLVGIDPRGVGHSTPELRCRTDAEFDAFRREPLADYSPAGVAHIERLYQQFVQSCVDRMGTEFLANVGTATSAQDMDVVRAALGENQINYLGFSYGTQLGAAYAERYPDRVRAMVLDGAIDPQLDPIDGRIRQMAGFQSAFDDYAADCAKSAGCPLGTDPARFVERYHQLVNPLVQRPAQTSDPRGLSYQDAITGTVNALYSQRYWKYLTSGLLGLQRGTDAGDLLLLADEYQGRDESGHYTNQQDAFTAIGCVDSPYPSDPAAWAQADRRIREVAPFLSYGTFTGFAPRDVCAMWPVPPTSTPHAATSPGPGKVVVVSTTRDPATPYQAGVDLARQMDARLITFDGTQHTVVFNGDACVDTAVVEFLVRSVVPPAGLRC